MKFIDMHYLYFFIYPLHLLSIICNYKSWNTCYGLVVPMIIREVDCAQLDGVHNYMSNLWDNHKLS